MFKFFNTFYNLHLFGLRGAYLVGKCLTYSWSGEQVNLPKGFGYVEFKTRVDAEKAQSQMDGVRDLT
jgi:hypothetical protein